MKQLEYFPLHIPCARGCRFNHRNLCQQCFRTLGERDAWAEADDAEKRAILARSHQRRLQAQRDARRAQQRLRQRPVQQFELFPPLENAPLPPFHPAPASDDDHPQLALFPEIGVMVS